MHNLPHANAKLVPLRRFALEGFYNVRYLSQLVQRGKLKAKQVGRNFCTTREWFEEYLEQHALDETRIAYQKLFAEVDRAHSVKTQEIAAPIELSQNSHIRIPKRVVIIAALFMLLALATYFVPRMMDRKGRIAGQEAEEIIQIDQINSLNQFKSMPN